MTKDEESEDRKVIGDKSLGTVLSDLFSRKISH